MFLRRSLCRLNTPSSGISRFSPSTMPLRAKINNPAFGATARVCSLDLTIRLLGLTSIDVYGL